MPLTRQNHRPRRRATIALVVIVSLAGVSTPLTVVVPRAEATPVAVAKLAPGEFALPPILVSGVEAVPVTALVAQAAKRPAGTEPPQALKAGTPAFDQGGKPVVVFIGAEYCPYCSSERWPLVMALSKFGTFQGLRGSTSSPSDVDPSTPSFSFYGSSYTSRYLSFVADEEANHAEQTLQAPTPEEQALIAKYDTTPYVPAADAGENPIPFVYMAGKYVLTGTQFSPAPIAGMSWAAAATFLTSGTNAESKAAEASAGYLVGDICVLTHNTPAIVCSQVPADLVGITIASPAK